MVNRIALVAGRASSELFGDGPLLVAAFAGVGMHAEIVPWGTGRQWAQFDAVIVRGAYDYVLDRDGFLDWAAEVASVTRLANSLEVLRWNTDKRYLRDLVAAGVPTVPTVWVDCGEPVPRPGWDDFVVKPSVSAGSRLSARYRRGDDPEDLVRRIHATGASVMIQPYVSSVDDTGESGTYVFGGDVSHAIRKGPALALGKAAADDFSGAFSQSVVPAAVDPELAAFALRVLAAAPPLVYARVDTARGADGEPLLLELEATEPYLFLEHEPGAADRFARAVAGWLPGQPLDPGGSSLI